jgi:Ser/Thr protein kinase RdoA (MazF antagonist)
MNRAEIVSIFERDAAGEAAALFGAAPDRLSRYADSEGCQNLVYACERDGQPAILRISFRPDRSPEQIEAELHFVNYLADHGAGVARPLPSRHGRFVETLSATGARFVAAAFAKGRGMRVPDNGYRYREGVAIEEYFRNWGRVLGHMHALAKKYQPPAPPVRRPQWHELERFDDDAQRVPDRYPAARARFRQLMEQLKALPEDNDTYGLIHGDFNDGNFTVDYDNGDITVFDFDDSCYFWYGYELACAWEGGVGRAMFKPLDERKAFMARYMDQVLEGYSRHNTLDAACIERLPLFLKVVQMEEFLYYAQSINDADEETQAGLRYKARCIEEDLPYLGFFDPIFSPERPFMA